MVSGFEFAIATVLCVLRVRFGEVHKLFSVQQREDGTACRDIGQTKAK